MPITYPLSLPTNRTFAQVSFRMQNVVAISRSPFTFQQQVVKYDGEMWSASVSLPPMKREEAYPWVAFLMALKGRYGTFYLHDPDAVNPVGLARLTPGTPVMDGAQTGSEIAIRGCPAAVIGYLSAGDYLQIGTSGGSTLHKVVQSVNTDGSGDATATIWPALRRTVSDGTPINLFSAKGVFRLAENSAEYDIGLASSYGLAFSCEEHVQ